MEWCTTCYICNMGTHYNTLWVWVIMGSCNMIIGIPKEVVYSMLWSEVWKCYIYCTALIDCTMDCASAVSNNYCKRFLKPDWLFWIKQPIIFQESIAITDNGCTIYNMYVIDIVRPEVCSFVMSCFTHCHFAGQQTQVIKTCGCHQILYSPKFLWH